MPRNDYNAQEKCKTLIETELLNNNFYIYRWRQVPINTSVLGVKAVLTRPEIVQVIFKSNDKKLKFKERERQLYVIRRTVEKKALNFRLKDFYICSFSSKSIIYKGMFLAEALSEFYPDLQDERFISRFAIEALPLKAFRLFLFLSKPETTIDPLDEFINIHLVKPSF